MVHLLNMPAAEAAWAQCAKTPRDPDRRSPCPPHLLPLPSTLQEITEKTSQSQMEGGAWCVLIQLWCVNFAHGKHSDSVRTFTAVCDEIPFSFKD